MTYFWRNRLAALLIPQLLVNASGLIWAILIIGGGKFNQLLHVDHYVLVLLEYCLWFNLVHLFRKYYSVSIANALLLGGVCLSSIVMYFFFDKGGWCYERLGLVWGLLLYLNLSAIKRFVEPNIMKIIFFVLLSLLLGIGYLTFKPVFFWGEYLLKIILGVVIIVLIFILSSKLTLGNKAINYLGNISYEVYLSHGMVMGLLTYICPKLSSGVFILSTVIITIVFSAIIHSIGKPLIKVLRK